MQEHDQGSQRVQVNQRLEKEEAEAGGKRGDPQHPKRQWRMLFLCLLCAQDDAMATADSAEAASDPDLSWDLEYVHSFLYNFYSWKGVGGVVQGKEWRGSLVVREGWRWWVGERGEVGGC
ncbi:hypothetical protein CLOM_g6393 [Closterium sp. NIES-68]|nr:hypothetical protein CLOM_g6393 [Closterium sp. NIES-68]